MAYRLLVVDDEPAVRRYLSTLLGMAGYEIVTAADIPSAMHVMAERTTDLLITDVRLDGYNGLHLVAMAPEPIPSVVLTAYDDPAVEAEARQLGAEFFLKPVESKVLLAAVARLLGTLEEPRRFRAR
jgi:DNA-binding NtrC family response regulator